MTEAYSRRPDASFLDTIDLSRESVEALLNRCKSDAERADVVGLVEMALPLSSPARFAKKVDDTYLTPPHIQYLDKKLEDLVTGRLGKTKLLVTMPPRFGKSELCSKYVPAWFLARYPDRRVMLASYEAEFAADWGRKARDVLEQTSSWTGIRIRSDSKAAHRWNVEGRKGGMVTAGVRGPLTGKGGHLCIIDDPVKNSDEAMSETYRRKTWDWYISTLKTRLEPGAVQLLIMTRWHADDLAGKLLETEGSEWEVVNFPALAEEEDALGRQPGDSLWPGAYDRAALEAIRDAPETGYWWSALYQQRPTPEDGGFFKRATFKHWSFDRTGKLYMLDGLPVPVKDTLRFQTVDLAASTKTRADFTVVSTWAVTKTEPANLLLLGRFRGRVEAPEHLSLIEGEHDRWSARKEEPQVRFTGVEKQTYGMQVLQEAARRGFHWLRPLEADRDKFSRAIPAAQLADAGRLWFPQDASWLEDWESELLVFPNGTHDDQVDTLAYAALEIGRRRSWAPRVKEKEPDSMQERIWESIQKQRKRRGVHPVLGRW